jgi:hypothetical protein
VRLQLCRKLRRKPSIELADIPVRRRLVLHQIAIEIDRYDTLASRRSKHLKVPAPSPPAIVVNDKRMLTKHFINSINNNNNV